MEIFSIHLPSLPPTINHYYGFSGHRRWLTKAARDFRYLTYTYCKLWMNQNPDIAMPWTCQLHLELEFFLKDRRRADCDNRVKPLIDALQEAGIFEDDSQVYSFSAWKHPPMEGLKGTTAVRMMKRWAVS